MSRITFEKVTLRATWTGKCVDCRKRLTRSKTFFQTLNPWNKLKSGPVKTRRDILFELQADADGWREAMYGWITCASCNTETRRAALDLARAALGLIAAPGCEDVIAGSEKDCIEARLCEDEMCPACIAAASRANRAGEGEGA